MNLKKITMAAALSLGMMAAVGVANADQTGAACPVCPSVCPPPPMAVEQPCPVAAPCPCPCPTGGAVPVLVPQASCPQEVVSPCLTPACPDGRVPVSIPIQGCCPNCAPNAEIIERQAYAFPDIGGHSVIFPKGNDIVQMGGDEEEIAVNAPCSACGGLAPVPQAGALTVYPREDSQMGRTGAGCPVCPSQACPQQVAQGLEIFRCGDQGMVPNSMSGAACPNSPLSMNSISPMGAAAPLFGQTGAAAPIIMAPAGAAAPIMMAPTGGACPVCPQQACPTCDPCNPCGIPLSESLHDKNIVPVQAFYPNAANPCDPCNPCVQGAAAPLLLAQPATGAACPVCPQQQFTGAACPTCPQPIGAAAPLMFPQPLTGGACPVCPQQACPTCDPCTGGGAPIITVSPMGAACPVCPNPCDPCGSQFGLMGAAAGLQNIPTQQGAPIHIQTSSGLQTQKTALMQVTVPTVTGAAANPCPAAPQFPDVANADQQGCDVNKLAAQGILAGYPDRTYKPNLPIMRDEFASAMVSGLELQNVPDFQQQIFNDVSLRHWANSDIDKVYNRGLMAGYPNCLFKPDEGVTRAEALSAMAKVIPGQISLSEAQNILSCYPDANQLPAWATQSVAESLKAGLIKDLQNNAFIRPNDDASRAEIASMLDELRKVIGLEVEPQTTGAASALQPQIVTTTIPTLKMRFQDIISARTSEVDDEFVAMTTEPITIDGALFPAGTEVHGKVAEVIRPGYGESGAIRVEFTSIGEDGNVANLPREILSATVVENDTPNILGRVLAWPFSWPGKVAGVLGRTVGGATMIAANTTESFLTNIANGNNELLNLEAAAAGRSYVRALINPFEGVFDITRTALSGTFGVLKVTGDEIAYVVAADGDRIAQINPDEVLSVAFAVNQ